MADPLYVQKLLELSAALEEFAKNKSFESRPHIDIDCFLCDQPAFRIIVHGVHRHTECSVGTLFAQTPTIEESVDKLLESILEGTHIHEYSLCGRTCPLHTNDFY